MTESTWTNSTIRKRLGECGFIQVKDRDEEADFEMRTYWQRGKDMLMLLETTDDAPMLVNIYGNKIRPEDLGVRNENTQTGNHP